ncbi:MAG: sortase [Candidatus Portnoybacteria bacterium]|nr:sortase [Candidatus Portnoybacteria bacterium]MDD4983150.1 sortase [Candidatus Portnoybacteria bacterium]
MANQPLKNLLGCLPRAAFRNLLIGAAALILGILLGGPKIYISLASAIIVFCLMLIPYIAITWWSVWALAKDKAKGTLVTDGPYAYSRNPMYAAIIFLLNPSLGILFRSWILLLACAPIYFSWRSYVRGEERGALAAKFGAAHNEYMKNTARFFPNLRKISPVLFYSATGFLIFLISFIFLNFSALYLRWVVFETKGEIVYDTPSPQASAPSQSFPESPGQIFPPSANQADYNAADNSIFIEKLGIRAPLIQVSGTTQKELNDGLNQGVILYPGSALPEQSGEVVLSGHSSVFPWVKTRYGQVFTLLDNLKAGDIVSLVYNHRQYDYKITDQEILTPDKVKISDTNRQTLKLVTCWPIGAALKRLVVYGELIK